MSKEGDFTLQIQPQPEGMNPNLDTETPSTSEGEGEAPEPAESEMVLDEDLFKVLAASIFDLIAARKGEHWKLSEPEVNALAAPGTRVANRLMEKLGVQNTEQSDYVILLLTVLAIVASRMMEDGRLRREAELASERKAGSGLQAPSTTIEKPEEVFRPQPPTASGNPFEGGSLNGR